MNNKIKFEAPGDQSSIIKVIGVGGGGSNAVTYMYNQGIQGVDFYICNTDSQALQISPVMNKIQLGKNLTNGWGAGSKPEIGKNSALESAEDIKEILNDNTKMLFVTAGMGGGTGTGAAPVIAGIAKEMDILTVGIVTIPFSWEGRKRLEQALKGITELRNNVDSLLIICNDKLRESFGDFTLTEAFAKADDILNVAAKGIADIVNKIGKVNVDFEDVNTVMRNSGVAIMGQGTAEGDNRAIEVIKSALTSPLLNDNNIKGASNILLYITSGKKEITMDEIEEITSYIQKEAGATAEVIWGSCRDENLGDKIAVTIVATGFDYNDINNTFSVHQPKREIKINHLEDEVKKEEPIVRIEAKEIKEEGEIEVVNNKIINQIQKTIPQSSKELFTSKMDQLANDFLDNEFSKRNIRKEPEPQDIKNEKIFLFNQEDDKDKIEEKEEADLTQNKNDFSLTFPHNRESANEKIEKQIVESAMDLRKKRLRELSQKFNKPIDVEKLEKEPAFRRRDVQLKEVTPSSESSISKYTLGEDEDKNLAVKQNNSFLHDNVD